MKTLKEIAFSIPNHSKVEAHVAHYLEIYPTYLEQFRDKEINFLEIGIGKGGSPIMWQEYLPLANVYAGDSYADKVNMVNQKRKLPTEEFEEYVKQPKGILFDQANTVQIDKISENVKWDVVVDDGGHSMTMQINSLIGFWPHIAKGGYYIIEDLHTSYWPQFGGSYQGKTTIEFLKMLVDNLHAIHTTRNTFWDDAEWLRLKALAEWWLDTPCQVPQYVANINQDLEFIHFYDSLAVLKKRS